jgi:hypothetical protein
VRGRRETRRCFGVDQDIFEQYFFLFFCTSFLVSSLRRTKSNNIICTASTARHCTTHRGSAQHDATQRRDPATREVRQPLPPRPVHPTDLSFNPFWWVIITGRVSLLRLLPSYDASPFARDSRKTCRPRRGSSAGASRVACGCRGRAGGVLIRVRFRGGVSRRSCFPFFPIHSRSLANVVSWSSALFGLRGVWWGKDFTQTQVLRPRCLESRLPAARDRSPRGRMCAYLR